MVSRKLWGRVRIEGGILLQADDFGEPDQYGVSPDERQEHSDLSSGKRTVIGLTAVRQALDFGELMRQHRAMVFSVAWHFPISDERQEHSDLSSGKRTVIGLTAVRQALDFGELMRQHRAMVFSVAWHFL